jgi:hypothetical protein
VFSYETFISEATQLVVEAKQFNVKSEDDRTFQRWKHRLEDVMRRIRAEGYRPECEIFSRLFTNTSPWSTTPNEEVFVRAVDKTIIELETLIASFEKFGPPTPLHAPQKQINNNTGIQSAPNHTFHIHGGQVQIGDNNVQNIVNALHELKNKIDNADASPEQKQQAIGLLRGLIAHPLVTSVLGGLAGAIG